LTHPAPDSDRRARFEEAARAPQAGLVREMVDFLRDNKKWWLVPILVVFLGLGFLIFLSGTAAAPFVYTLF
jgi:hypothetical protein